VTAQPLLEHVRLQGEEAAARKLAEARATAASIAERTSARLEQLRAARTETRARALGAERDRICAVASHGANDEILSARNRFVDQVLQAMSALAATSLSDQRVVAIVVRDLDETLSFLPDRPSVVRATPALAALLRPLVHGIPGRQPELIADESIPSGITVAAADGSVRVQATLHDRITSERQRIAIALLRRVIPVPA
jgi:vacuolar-type H+-ATPase subunit E/Vma4